MNQTTKKKRNERGSVVVEAALVLPVVCLLLIGLMEFSRVLMIQQTLTNAAREAGRVAAIDLDDTSALSSADQIAKDFLTRTGTDLDRVTVTPVFADVNGTQAVEVQIQYAYDSFFTGWLSGSSGFNLYSRVTMRREA